MCAFNRASLIPRAVSSLLSQSFTDWELIIVNDGSTDSTSELVQNYADNDSRITTVTIDNVGIGGARNVGVGFARGLFITFLDTDDEYESNHLETRRAMLLDNQHVEMLYGGIRVVGNPYVTDRNNAKMEIHLDQCAVGGTFVIRSDVFDRIGLFDEVRYADDALFYERASARNVMIGKTEFPSYVYYRDTPDSLCTLYGAAEN